MSSISASPAAPNLRARQAIGIQYKLDHPLIAQTAPRLGLCTLFSLQKGLSNIAPEEGWGRGWASITISSLGECHSAPLQINHLDEC